MNKDRRTAIFFLTVLFLATIGFVATDIYLPSFPSIQTSLHAKKILVKLTLSFYLLGYAVAQIFSGPCSDRFGRKKIVIIGLSLSLIGSLMCIFSPNILFLILGRTVQGVGLGVGSTLWRAILRDSYSGDDLAHFGSFIAVGTAVFMALAPTIGGYVQYYIGWRINFLLVFVYTILGLVMVLMWMPETNRSFNPLATKLKIFISNYLHLLRSPVFVGYSLCASLAFGGLSAYFATSPFLFQVIIGLNSVNYGWLALFIGAGLCFGGFLNAFLVRRYGRHHTLLIGIALIVFSGVAMLVFGLLAYINTLAIMLPMGIFTLGAAMVFANSFAGAFQPFGKIAGFAGGLYGCIQFLGGTILSAVMTAINEKNQIPLAVILIIIGISCYFFQLLAFSYAVKQK